jgi:hypothetical protein
MSDLRAIDRSAKQNKNTKFHRRNSEKKLQQHLTVSFSFKIYLIQSICIHKTTWLELTTVAMKLNNI